MAFSKCAHPSIFLLSKSGSLCISTTGFTTFQADRSPTENCGYFSQSYSRVTQPQWSTRWHPFGSFWMNINVFITSGYTTVIWKGIFSTFSDRFREQLERCYWVLKLTSAPEVSVHRVNHLLPVAQKPVLHNRTAIIRMLTTCWLQARRLVATIMCHKSPGATRLERKPA